MLFIKNYLLLDKNYFKYLALKTETVMWEGNLMEESTDGVNILFYRCRGRDVKLGPVHKIATRSETNITCACNYEKPYI